MNKELRANREANRETLQVDGENNIVVCCIIWLVVCARVFVEDIGEDGRLY